MTNSFLLVCLSSARITDTKSKRMWTDPPPVAFSFAGLKLGWSFTCAFSFTTPTFPLGTHVNRRDASPPPHCVTTCRNNSLQSHCDYWGWVWVFFTDGALWSDRLWAGASRLPRSPWATRHSDSNHSPNIVQTLQVRKRRTAPRCCFPVSLPTRALKTADCSCSE